MSESQRTITVDEPPLPPRIRRPSDAIRFLLTVAAIGGVLLLAQFAHQTASGIERDVAESTKSAPSLLLDIAKRVAGFGVLIVPVAFAIDRLLRRDGMRVAIGVLAALIAVAVSLALDTWVDVVEPDGTIWNYLAGPRKDTVSIPQDFGTDLTPIIAYLTAVRMTGRPRWQATAWILIALAALASVVAPEGVTPLALGVTYLMGRAVGYGTLYLVGSPNTRPPGTAIVAALDRLGLRAAHCERQPDGPEEARRYHVILTDGRGLDVSVLDRDQQTAGQFYRLWRSLRFRSSTPRRSIRSVRRSLEQEALMAYATAAAGVRTPRIRATCEVQKDAALIAYEHIEGEPLSGMPDDDLTDDVLVEIWEQLQLLQEHRLAHRRLGDEAIWLNHGRPFLVDLRAGEIAASELLLRLDLAQMLTSLAMRAGPERTVKSAVRIFGPDTLAALLPLLQRVALSRGTRNALSDYPDLLTQIRDEIQRQHPRVEAEPVSLERFRLHTLLTIVAATAGAFVLLSYASANDPLDIIADAKWEWLIVGLAASAASYVAATLTLTGFVPERLPFVRTTLVQLAASFIKLVAPAAVSAVALNTRYLQRRGMRPGLAVASVGASQIVQMGLQVLLLLSLAFTTSSRSPTGFAPPRKVIVILLALAVAMIAISTVGRLRRFVTKRLRSLFSGVMPRLLDILQSPRKIASALIGPVLLQVLFVICLDASIRAMGGDPPGILTVAFIFLAANAVGSVFPTPGGIGGVEGALIFGLSSAGLGTVATAATLLFRLLTFWLPVLPGWIAYAYLQRKEAL